MANFNYKWCKSQLAKFLKILQLAPGAGIGQPQNSTEKFPRVKYKIAAKNKELVFCDPLN